MTNVLKFLLSSQLKRSRLKKQIGGFTLIELLVALILAFLVITPLLGFMINTLNTDRQEQAKANTEQELQAALDYITRDLQQAVYIYNDTGIAAITDTNATKSQLPPPDSTRVPVLVFWKRDFINKGLPITTTDQDDSFVYSLVAYYLIKDTNSTWSNAARIARWEISDGIQDTDSTAGSCKEYPDQKYISDHCPSPGFQRFNLDGSGNLESKMNSWKKALAAYTNVPLVLVDFIDQTTTGAPTATACATGSSKVPPSSFDALKMTSFYACVDTVNTTAQVFLRGNALARLQNNNLDYTDSKKAYFPSQSIRIQGHGYLFTK
ncbi:MAG: hormogonium polysaccharide secretion pseudopilin HpsC [Rhizonema sp. PD38]|nr:hormogonium polysaccharide secretion pseudopilin HpsC [Rhizonema sp. PD38]